MTIVKLKDAKPFVKVELQKISETLDRTEKLKVTSEEILHRGALSKAMKILEGSSTKGTDNISVSLDNKTEIAEAHNGAKHSSREKESWAPPKKTQLRGISSTEKNTTFKRKTDCSATSTAKPTKRPKTSDNRKTEPNKPKLLENAQQNAVSNTSKTSKKNNASAKRDGISHRRNSGLKIVSHSSSTTEKNSSGNRKKRNSHRSTAKEVDHSASLCEDTDKANPRPTPCKPQPEDAGKEDPDYHTKSKYNHLPFEEFSFAEADFLSSELSMECSSPESTTMQEVCSDTEEDMQLPVIPLKKGLTEPSTFSPGTFVWCKYQRYPFWPSLVKNVNDKKKRAGIIFVEECLSDPNTKKQSFRVAFHTLKHYDCPEKQELLTIARKDYGKSVDWCEALICDYRIRLGCGSFTDSFYDYCTAAISLPVRREYGKVKLNFPSVCSKNCDPPPNGPDTTNILVSNKVLPDRARASRDRANEKLVDCIVTAKQAESHLRDILAGKRKSQWLLRFQSSNGSVDVLETYIEDEAQVEVVVSYLQSLCDNMSRESKKLMNGDQTKFILEVMLPEAVVYAISATNNISYENAEKKFLDGPLLSKRERKLFEERILDKKKARLAKHLHST
ncbi:PWWP domain-containing DNA repair factor 3A isoform X2 [Hyperolius riggenbachi]|uniref:PWWP domain-containing DNA repair factor 3A isoform X2 n=1 Tax=Hyperolius riggenbachi TaxID=752182 RepID=UPI0035A27549